MVLCWASLRSAPTYNLIHELTGLHYRYVGANPRGRNAALILPYNCKCNCRAFVGHDKVWNTVRAER